MAAARTLSPTTPAPVLSLAFTLGWSAWKLGFTTGPATSPRLRTLGARNRGALRQEIAKATRRFGLAADTPVLSCYQAGRDGFWLHRCLAAQGLSNLVVDSARSDGKRRARRLRTDAGDPGVRRVRRLLERKGIGAHSAWLFERAVFGWRPGASGKELGALAGLTPTPSDSGESSREQGISKAGTRRLRTRAVASAGGWLQGQSGSALRQGFRRRFGGGNRRQRRVGRVALARQLLVARGRYRERGERPEGAATIPWRTKLGGRPRAAAGVCAATAGGASRTKDGAATGSAPPPCGRVPVGNRACEGSAPDTA